MNIDQIQQAAALLRDGKLVAFPTETVYGLGADATNPLAVARIFEVKERPRFDPLIVHLAAPDWLQKYVESVPSEARKLAEKFWPGPLTLVLPKKTKIPDIVTAGLPTVAVRVPFHPLAHAFIAAAAVPVAAPSANRFGRISPTTADAVRAELGDRVDFILDGGKTLHGIESTVISFEENGPRILRPGPITREMIQNLLGCEVPVASVSATPRSPGQLPRHYAPSTPLQLVARAEGFTPPQGKRVGLLAFHSWRVASQKPAQEFTAIEVLSAAGDLREAAANLFSALRRLDAAGLDLIVAESVPEQGLGLAIMDRLRKAAEK